MDSKEGTVRGLNLDLKWNGNDLKSFYCRVQNRVLEDGCPNAKGSSVCPLRRNCPAHTHMTHEGAGQSSALHSP